MESSSEAVLVTVADGRDAHLPLVLEAQEVVQVRLAHAAHPNLGDHEATVRAGLARRAEDARRNKVKGSDSQGAGFEKMPAADASSFSRRVCLRNETTRSAAAPGVAFPAERLAAARGIGNMTKYFKAGEGKQGRSEATRIASLFLVWQAVAKREDLAGYTDALE